MDNIIVIAIGGNSIIKPGEKGTIEQQWKAAQQTCKHIAQVIKAGNNIVLTHGNGPQVGNILLRSELSGNLLPTLPLDVCVADSLGAMGYMLQQLLSREIKKIGINKTILSVVTQVAVDKNDPAFQNPSKPIGPFYSKEDAQKHKIEDRWDIIEDSGRGFRRVVASPKPLEIIELPAIKDLVRLGYVVIAAGGGGIPVIRDNKDELRGCPAVIDKDTVSSMLAVELKAKTFVITTAVDYVMLDFGAPNQRKIENASLDELKQYVKEGHFKEGSMLPKINAVINYLQNEGKHAIITSPELLEDAVNGKAGSHFYAC
jgi:carbamate kinase